MVITKKWLVEHYNKYNEEIFHGQLPSLQRSENQTCDFDLAINNTRNTLGLFCMEKKPSQDLKLTIKVSNYFDRSESDYIDTLVHEMIHCYLDYNGIRDTSAHGVEFRRFMNIINQNYGLHIDVTSHKVWKPSNPKNCVYYMLAFETIDGRYFVARLSTTNLNAIVSRYAQSPSIANMELYRSTNINFEAYRKNTLRGKLRGRHVTKDKFESIVNGLEKEQKIPIQR